MPVGRFVWRVPEDSWWWSDQMFAIHGFEPGQVVPSTDLVLSHKHPDDLDRVREVLREIRESPGDFGCYHRIIDARRHQRSVVAVGQSLPGDGAEVGEVRGFLVDLTRARRADFHEEVTAAVEGATRHRAAIEQVKGALMFAHGLDEDAAFALLRQLSSTTNTKLAVLAERLSAQFADGEPLAEEPRQLLRVMLEESVHGHEQYDDLGDTGWPESAAAGEGHGGPSSTPPTEGGPPAGGCLSGGQAANSR